LASSCRRDRSTAGKPHICPRVIRTFETFERGYRRCARRLWCASRVAATYRLWYGPAGFSLVERTTARIGARFGAQRSWSSAVIGPEGRIKRVNGLFTDASGRLGTLAREF